MAKKYSAVGKIGKALSSMKKSARKPRGVYGKAKTPTPYSSAVVRSKGSAGRIANRLFGAKTKKSATRPKRSIW